MKFKTRFRERFLGGILVSLGLGVLAAGSAVAGTIVQDFYVPLEESQIYAANNTIVAGTGSTIFSTISIHVVSDNTVIYYDQWEDGYEVSLGSPTQSTTRIWGDGNDAHGIPPGLAHNPLGLAAGTVITLTNAVVTQPRNPAIIQYDGRDHIGATRPIVVTRAHWPSTTGTVIAGAVSVLSTAEWGTNYLSPVGQNMTNGLMGYVGLFVQAMQNNTAVTIDPTGTNGAGVTNIVMNQGESYLYNGGVLQGGKVSASAPVQADLVIGHKNASYAVDWFNLYPVTSWGNTYYTPVGSAVNGQPAYVYLYNPNTNALNLKVTTKVGVSTVTVPGTNGVKQFTMPASSGASFVATNGGMFYAICTVAASPAADTTWNWGFSLVPTQILTTEEDVGWAPGSSDGTADGSPVWVTPLAATTLYVVYGDNTNFLTDPAGGKYNTNFNVTAFQSLKIYDPSRNQTGMRIYTLDGTLITAAWGEDADVAAAGNPCIDAGYTVLPFPVPTLTKTVANLSNPGQAVSTNGTVLLYTVTIGNNNLAPLAGIVLRDLPSPRLKYVTGSTTNFTTLATNAVPDNTGGAFPLLAPGYTNGVIQAQSSLTFTYLLTVTNNLGAITNLATIPSSVTGSGLLTSLTADTTLPVMGYVAPVINFTDTNGVVTNAYTVGLTNIYVTVTDTNANLSPTAVDTIQVTVLNTNTGDYEALTLIETGTNTSVFRNPSGLPSSATSGLYPNDGVLNGTSGNGMVVTYVAGNGLAYTTNATLFGTSGGSGGGSGGGGSGNSSFPLKQLYLNQATNGATVTTNGLNRLDPVHYGFGPALLSGAVTAGWYNNSWLYRKSITINHNQVPNSDQTNFPVLISLTSDADLEARALASGNDLLFTAADGVTKLAYERETYTSGSGALVAWVNVPTVSHTADTVIYLYYGNAAAADQQQATSTWNSNYKSVWHFTETSGTLHDSTSTGNTATDQGGATLGASGKIGNGVALNAANSTYLSTTTDYPDPTPYTISIWFYTTPSAPTGRKIFGLESAETGTGAANADRMFYVNSSGKLVGGMYDTSTGAPNSGRETVVSSSAVTNSAWHYAVLTYSNTTLTCFLDGTSLGTTTVTNAQTYSAGGWWRMGSYTVTSWPGATTGYFTGSIDEARYSAIARSADWIASEYNNANSPSTFYTLGTQMAGSNSFSVFTQTPALALPFAMPSNGVVTITNYITLTNGSFTAAPNVTAFLLTNGVAFLALTNPAFNSGAGVNTNLVWTAVLTNSITILAGQAISYVVSNAVSGTAFQINYGSSSYPSEILLPASTVISINSLGIYDAAYPGGNLVSSPTAGTPLYIRALVSDPFGNYDISSVGLSLTAPGSGVTSANASVVATTATNAVYEYAWNATTAVGNYSIVATAYEGTEGITATAAATLTTAFQDQGTPNTTTFTSGNNGASTNAYPLNNGTACVLVEDVSANTNPNLAETVTVTVSSSAGGAIQVPLTETGTNTGFFANCFNTTTTQVNTNSSTLYAPAGTVLTANYSSVTSPAFQSSATAIIQPAPGVSSLAVTKTIVSPAGGQALLGNQVTYNIQVLNNGSTTLSGLAVTDGYPSQLTFSSAGPAPAITNLASRLLIWTNLGPFTPGQGTNLTASFAATNASPATNSAWVGGGTLGTLVTNSVPLAILNPAVTVFKTVLNPAATNQIGSNVIFQIVITNSGNTTIPMLPMEDDFSGACFQFVSNNIVSTNAAAITGRLPSSGFGSLVWTNLAPATGLAPGGVITNDVTLLVTGAGYPALNTATVDYAVDTNGLAVPASSATASVTNAAASISGYVYNDPAHTGTYAAGDIGLTGVTVSLYTDSNNVPGTLVAAATTGANGAYQFLNLSTNNYLVVETLLSGFAASSAVNLATNVTTLAAYPNLNFFAYVLAATNYASISGSVTNDLNWNGVANAGEPGLANVTINLVQDLNSNGLVSAGEPVVFTTTTDTNGNYSFIDLTPGRYVIQASVPYGYNATNVTVGANSGGFLAATNASGTLTNFTQIGLVLTNGQNSLQNNFLVTQPVTIGGFTWLDVNGNGLQDTGEPALGAVAVALYQTNALTHVMLAVTTNVSSLNGQYLFTNTPPGSYQLLFVAPTGGYTHSPAGQGNPTNDSAANAITGFTPLLTYAAGASDLTENAGFEPNPTAVTAVSLRAYVNQGEAWVSWQTFNEAGLLAFDLTRGTDGLAAQDVTPDWVFASGLDLGATYTVPDPGATLPGAYTYNLYGYYDNGAMLPLASVQVQLAGSASTNSTLQLLSFEITGSTGRLIWSGGQPPYVVQQSGSLGADAVWQTVGATTNTTQWVLPLNGQAGFFRVQALGQ